MEELKPCPFCGGKAAIRTSTTNTIPKHARAYCYCKKCLSIGRPFDDDEDDGTCVFKAVEAWNTRAE